MDNNGWDDQPGVPLNPAEPDFHWVESCDGTATVVFWRGHGGDTHHENGDLKELNHWSGHPMWQAKQWRYIGPCLTPAKMDARVADALKWRDAINDWLTNWLSPIEDYETPADALQRLVRLEVDAALDPAVSQSAADLVAQARRDALEEAAHELKERSAFWAERTNHEALIRADECQKIVDVLNAMAKGEKE
jgi:FtsZ-binding cell division protein ZapB